MTRDRVPPLLVSILTPALRAARFLQDTLETVRQQASPGIEHIVVDGGSDDGTVELLRQYPHVRWISKPDEGQSAALNKGLRMAKGAIIGWLNADDMYAPGAIAAAANYLVRHPEACAVYGDMEILDERSRVLRLRRSRPFDLADLFTANYINQPTVFMRRAAIEEAGGLDESLHHCMDRELWLRLGSKGELHYIPGWIGARFRVHPGSKTAREQPAFHAEWLGVVRRSVADPRFAHVHRGIKEMAFHQARVRLRLASMRDEVRKGRPGAAMRHGLLLLAEDWLYVVRYPIKRLRRVSEREGLAA